MSTSPSRILISSAILGVMLVVPKAGFAQQIDANAAAILKLWEAREAKFKSGRIVWKEKRLIKKGTLTADINAYGGGPKTTDIIPPEDITHVYNGSLLFSGEKLRFKDDMPVWSTIKNNFVASQRDGAWNGETGFYFNLEPERKEPQGGLSRQAGTARADIRVGTFMNYYRPSSRQTSLPLAPYATVDTRKTEDGRDCVVLSRSRRGRDVRDEVWIDLTRGGSIEREASTLNGKVLQQTDISYTEDPEHGWIISGWERNHFAVDGTLEDSTTATVLEAKFNIPLAQEHFELNFPTGTVVTDVRSGKPVRYTVPHDEAE